MTSGAETEVAISQRRRDWAFSERDKVIRERDSIRTLSDNLRREKDRAVAKLAEALRESDDIQKHNSLMTQQHKLLKWVDCYIALCMRKAGVQYSKL